MSVLIRQGSVASDHWRLIGLEEGHAAGDLDAVLLPLAAWRTVRDAALPPGRGVWLLPHEDPAELLPDLSALAVVALRFPVFTDGRAYTQARLLRERYGYAGELRAIGDVLTDQLAAMARCGFDAFLLREDQKPEVALAALAGAPASPWPRRSGGT